MAEVRIRGLVKLMEAVRHRTAEGLSPGEAAELEREIARQVAAVERLCARQGITPAELPAPSRQAWEYLCAFRANPVCGAAGKNRKQRLSGLATACRSFLNQLTEADSDALFSRFLEESVAWSARARARLAGAGATAADLPEAQQRLLARLEYYTRPGAARRIRDNAGSFREALRAEWPTGFLRPPRPLLYWEPGGSRLWKLERGQGAGVLRCNDIFLIDPRGQAPLVLARSVCAAARGRRQGGKALVEWARGEAVDVFRKEIEAAVVPDREAARGRQYDLYELFHRLNERFFGGALTPGPLSWGVRRAHSRTGIYDPATGGIRLSPVLDGPGVPGYVVEFVLYHEMLHLVQDGEGRLGPGRRIHTAAFRTLERRYPRWREAEDYLTRLAQRGGHPPAGT